MRFYLVQHGKALTEEEDETRPLSKKGVEETRLLAKQLSRRGITIEKIYHSGKLRARQTAEIFFETLLAKSMDETAGLKPKDDLGVLMKSLDFDNALYVGHLPHLNKLASCLLCGDENKEIVGFENSAVLALDRNCMDGSGVSVKISWYITPEVC